MLRRPFVAALSAALAAAVSGCRSEPFPAPIRGSTYRLTEDRPADGSELRIDVLQTWEECANARIDDMDACLPRVDRAHGELHLAFVLRDPVSGATVRKALEPDQVQVTHDASAQDDVELVPHDPVTGGQLYILLIDGSGSMYEGGGERIRKVYDALRDPGVVEGFYPDDDGKTGVVLLRFSGPEVVGLDGGPPRVITRAAEYRRMVDDHLLEPSGGYTHLYGATRYAVTELLAHEDIDAHLAIHAAEPTLVLLTDGFNNESAADRCKDNVPRLAEALDVIRAARTGAGASARTTIFAVGLGRPYGKHKKPSSLNQAVTTRGLCGPYADFLVDPDLEDAGIDHVSLAWLAEAGGGVSFVKQDREGLAEVFKKAASPRHRWFELKVRVPDGFHHRQTFDVKLRLLSYARAEAGFTVSPSPWLDAPGGRLAEGERWTTPRPLRAVLAFLVPALGLLVLLAFLGPAWFNTRRAISRRTRPRR